MAPLPGRQLGRRAAVSDSGNGILNAIDASSYVGLAALALLTLNILFGLLLSTKYNPVRNWPHRRVNTLKLHNWTGYVALAVSVVHPTLILFSSTAGFGVVDLFYPVHAPKQPMVNTFGAIAVYSLTVVVVTSYFRFDIGRQTWKAIHFTAYGTAVMFFIHGLLTDPKLKDSPFDPLDAEKVYVELCLLLVIVGIVYRIRWQVRQGTPRTHRPKQARSASQKTT